MNETKPEASSCPVLRRVVRYMLHYYKLPFHLVVCCILVSAVATVVAATFPQTLVDDYITPMLASGSTDFSGLARHIVQLLCVLSWALRRPSPITASWSPSARAPCSTCGTTCSTGWSPCPSSTLTPTPTATSCPCTPTTWTPCGSCSARASPRSSTPASPWWPPW